MASVIYLLVVESSGKQLQLQVLNQVYKKRTEKKAFVTLLKGQLSFSSTVVAVNTYAGSPVAIWLMTVSVKHNSTRITSTTKFVPVNKLIQKAS